MCDCAGKAKKLADKDCTCTFSKHGEGEGKQEEDEETKQRRIERRQKRIEKKLEDQIRKQEALIMLRSEIAERVEKGESLTVVLEKVGVKIDSGVIAAATTTRKERKRNEEVAAAKVALQEKIKQEKKEKAEREESASTWAARGPEYWLPLIGSTLLFIGISSYLYRCFNMTCVIKRKAKEVSKYITTAFCNEIERRQPKPVYVCKMPNRPKVYVTKKEGGLWSVDEIEDVPQCVPCAETCRDCPGKWQKKLPPKPPKKGRLPVIEPCPESCPTCKANIEKELAKQAQKKAEEEAKARLAESTRTAKNKSEPPPCNPCPTQCVPCPAILQQELDKQAEEQAKRDESEVIRLETEKRRIEILEKRDAEIKQKKEYSLLKKAKEAAVKTLMNEIAHRIEMGESMTEVLASVGVNSKTVNSKSAALSNVLREKRQKQEMAKAAAEEERRIRIEERIAKAQGTYLPPHGTLYWVLQIACALTFIGMIRSAWKCLNMTCLIKRKYRQLGRYIIVAMCCETQKCVPKRWPENNNCTLVIPGWDECFNYDSDDSLTDKNLSS